VFDGYAPDRGKWKPLAIELFNLDVLKDSRIDQMVAPHLKDNVYIKTYWAYIVDM
jgi:hypothetical protein